MFGKKSDSTVGTVIGIVVVLIAVGGALFFDWTWGDPDGPLLPVLLGIAAALGGALVFLRWRNR